MKSDLEVECEKFTFIIEKLFDGSTKAQQLADSITSNTRITDMPVLGDALIKIALSLQKKPVISISTQTE